MDFRYSYWTSGFSLVLSLSFIILSIVSLILGKGDPFIMVFIIVQMLFVLGASIFTLRQIPKDKIKDMSLKERRIAKLKKIK